MMRSLDHAGAVWLTALYCSQALYRSRKQRVLPICVWITDHTEAILP